MYSTHQYLIRTDAFIIWLLYFHQNQCIWEQFGLITLWIMASFVKTFFVGNLLQSALLFLLVSLVFLNVIPYYPVCRSSGYSISGYLLYFLNTFIIYFKWILHANIRYTYNLHDCFEFFYMHRSCICQNSIQLKRMDKKFFIENFLSNMHIPEFLILY